MSATTGFYGFIYKIFSYPIGWVINLFYNVFGHNYLLAVIMVAVLVKLILLPTSIKTQKSQATSRRMRKRVEKIKAQYADDQQKQTEAIQEFYKKEGYGSMSSGCGTMLIQFPIIIGLFGAIYFPLTYVMQIDRKFGSGIIDTLKTAASNAGLIDPDNSSASRFAENIVISNIDTLKVNGVDSSVIEQISNFNQHFNVAMFSFGDIPKELFSTNKGIILIPLLAFVCAMASSIYSLVRMKKQQDQNTQSIASMGCMLLFMPFFSLWLAYQFPVGIGIYWAVNSLLGVLQMILLDKIYTPDKVIAKIMVDESTERKDKEELLKQSL